MTHPSSCPCEGRGILPKACTCGETRCGCTFFECPGEVTEVSPQSTKLHNIENILKKFIDRETHKGTHARVVVQLAGILAERERAAALHQKQELKRKVLEVVPLRNTNDDSCRRSDGEDRCSKHENTECSLCYGFNIAASAIIQFFDKEEGE